MAAANTLATPCLVFGLYGVSRSTRITVESTGEEHTYNWLPAWLAFGAAAALLVFLARELRSPNVRPRRDTDAGAQSPAALVVAARRALSCSSPLSRASSEP